MGYEPILPPGNGTAMPQCRGVLDLSAHPRPELVEILKGAEAEFAAEAERGEISEATWRNMRQALQAIRELHRPAPPPQCRAIALRQRPAVRRSPRSRAPRRSGAGRRSSGTRRDDGSGNSDSDGPPAPPPVIPDRDFDIRRPVMHRAASVRARLRALHTGPVGAGHFQEEIQGLE